MPQWRHLSADLPDGDDIWRQGLVLLLPGPGQLDEVGADSGDGREQGLGAGVLGLEHAQKNRLAASTRAHAQNHASSMTRGWFPSPIKLNLATNI